ncbi:MAG: HAD-IIIA family hydrolase, partial [Rhodospirillales bacterium]|nr:HAD-IIIA family hydrolase [Rhodospirillales bacterium]
VVPGIAALIAAANSRAVPVVIVTNQSGVGRGLYGWSDFNAVQSEIARHLANMHARWDAVFASPFPPGNWPMRKPHPGMLLAGAEAFDLDLERSWILGDRATDMEAGQRAGIEGGLFVGNGYDDDEIMNALAHASDSYAVRRIAKPHQALMHLPFLKNA